MSLLETPPPEFDEPARGYYRRLAEQNGYWSWKDIAAIAGQASRTNYILNAEQTARALGLEAKWTRKVARAQRDALEWKKYHRRGGDAVCPECLGENAYLRASWEHVLVTACPLHRTSLIDHCMTCGSRLIDGRRYIRYCSCGQDLSTSTTAPASGGEVWLSGLLGPAKTTTDTKPLIVSADTAALSELVILLCRQFDLSMAPERQNAALPTSVADAKALLSPLDVLIRDWPEGFEQHVSERLASASSTARTLNAALGPWYQLLKKHCAEGPLRPFLDAVLKIAAEEFAGVIGLDAAGSGGTDSAFILSTEATRRLGIPRDQLLQAIEKGLIRASKRQFGSRRLASYLHRTEVERVARLRAEWITDLEACEKLDVPGAVLGYLADSGLITRDQKWSSDVLKAGPIELASVDKLTRELNDRAIAEEGNESATVQLTELNSRKVGDRKALLSLFTAIGNGDIVPVKRAQNSEVGHLEFRKSDIESYFVGLMRDTALTIQELSKITGWKYESIDHWIKQGLLGSRAVTIRGKPCRVLTLGHLLNFQRCYVPLADLAMHLATTPSAIAKARPDLPLVGARPLPNGSSRGALVPMAALLGKVRRPTQSDALQEMAQTISVD